MAWGFFKGTKAKLLPSTGIEFSDGRFYTYGSGSPEGVVTATVGSFYSDTTNGIIYTKNSGAGNTGWVSTVALTEMATGSMSAPGLPFVGDANTGIFQPNVNRLGITTDGQERFMVDENGRLYNVYDGDQGTDYRTTLHAGWLPRAWAIYNGVTVTLIASGNISSVTYNAAGDYTFNFLVAMPDSSYGPQAISQPTTSFDERAKLSGTNTVNGFTVVNEEVNSNTDRDTTLMSVMVMR